MHSYKFLNINQAIPVLLEEIVTKGQNHQSRLGQTKELLHTNIEIIKPLERVYFLNNLDSNIFAQIAGSWWVLSGNNDLDFLGKYLPNAQKRSDDSITWRSAFGPRIRNWHGVDQLLEVVKLLNKRPESRRASMVLFDPIYDFQESKDVSTCVAVHFTTRLGSLDMTVDMRSMSILGSSSLTGNNSFEWSILHEIVAFCTQNKVGSLIFNINSFHLYQEDSKQAKLILQNNKARSLVEYYPKYDYSTKIEKLDEKLRLFYQMENRIWSGEEVDFTLLGDDLLISSLMMLNIFYCQKSGNRKPCQSLIEAMSNLDFKQAAYNFIQTANTI